MTTAGTIKLMRYLTMLLKGRAPSISLRIVLGVVSPTSAVFSPIELILAAARSKSPLFSMQGFQKIYNSD